MDKIPSGLENSDDEFLELLTKFKIEYSSDDALMTGFFEFLNLGRRCSHCQSARVKRPPLGRSLICGACNRRSWITKGTLFEGAKKIQPWFVALWFRAHGVALSSSKLAQVAGVSQSTAWTILKKLDLVLASRLSDFAVSVPSGIFTRLFTRRSSVTPALSHPSAEESLREDLEETPIDSAIDSGSIGEGDPAGQDSSQSMVIGSTEQALLLCLSQLEPGGNCSFDELLQKINATTGELSASLVMLELTGKIRVSPGDRFSLVTEEGVSAKDSYLQSMSAEVESARDRFIEFVQRVHGGISRKYLQLSLAAFGSLLLLPSQTLEGIFEVCARTRRVKISQIMEYDSPSMVFMEL